MTKIKNMRIIFLVGHLVSFKLSNIFQSHILQLTKLLFSSLFTKIFLDLCIIKAAWSGLLSWNYFHNKRYEKHTRNGFQFYFPFSCITSCANNLSEFIFSLHGHCKLIRMQPLIGLDTAQPVIHMG